MARKQRAEQWTEHRRQRDEQERHQRVMVITEFDAGDPEVTLHALAGEDPEVPSSCEATGEGDWLGGRWRAVFR
jgi:hypothetical protein